MACIEERTRQEQVRRYARLRVPAGEQKVKVFDRCVDAERYLTTVESAKLTGRYVDAKRATVSFRTLAEAHHASYPPMLAADATRMRKRSVLDRHMLPTLGRYSLGTVKPSTVASAVGIWSQMSAPGAVGQVLRQVRQILDAALVDGLIPTNAPKSVKGPPAPRRRDVHLTDENVAVSHWLGHSSPEITYRVYAYLKPDDEQAGRDAIAETVRHVVPHVYPLCTEEGSQ